MLAGMPNDLNSSAADGPRTRCISRTKLSLAVCLLLVGVSLVVLSRHFSSKPDGVYYDPRMGSVGNAYWVFNAGQIHLRTSGPSQTSGSYSKSGNQWVSGDGSTVFKPGLLGIRTIDKTNPANDRFLFRRGTGWLADAHDFLHDRLR